MIDLSGQDLREIDNLLECDLSEGNLERTNLSGMNLQGIDFRYTKLSFSNLASTDLTDANLSCSNLASTDLTNANLSNVELVEANLTNANLTNADLTGANLSGANLTGVNLTNAKGLGTKEGEISFAKDLLFKLESEDGYVLEMSSWHTCRTTHCIAGWYAENIEEPGQIASLALPTLAQYFYHSNDEALGAIQRVANGEESVFP